MNAVNTAGVSEQNDGKNQKKKNVTLEGPSQGKGGGRGLEDVLIVRGKLIHRTND